MRLFAAMFTVLACGIVAAAAEAPALRIEAGEPQGKPLVVKGPDARRQLLVSADADGQTQDATSEVKYDAAPAGVVQVDARGMLTPVGDGAAVVTARDEAGRAAALDVRVEEFAHPQSINFANQIVPIFTKTGCNAGGCHGKSGGQNGFKLSLLGFEPTEDFEHLVKEGRGRRLFPAAPDRSLLLQKAVASMPHGGGKRLDADSDDYRLLVRWIRQGMPYGSASDPVLARVIVSPEHRVLKGKAQQQLAVTAIYSDGSQEDVTRSALFEPNDANMAKVDAVGRVQVADQPGDVAVMVRYQGKVAVFTATIPLGPALVESSFPPTRNFIDERVFAKLKNLGLPPSPLCDDGTFIRRVTIDVAGRFPTPQEVETFQNDPSSDKRDRWIDQLLDSSDYADYFANKWSALLRNRRGEPGQMRGTFLFHGWIRDSFLTNKPYDQFVRELLTASGEIESNPPVAWYRQLNQVTAMLEDTSQLFMGMRLQCAQCHHHPFEKWSQQDYYGLAAFFSQVRQEGGRAGQTAVFHRRGQAGSNNPKTKQTVRPAGLGAVTIEISADDDPRAALADWLTAPANPFFSRSLVNRYWKHFFGRGIVDPEDDMRDTNPPSNPALLADLSQHFSSSGYDLKDLVRTICRSSAYQLDSTPNSVNAVDRQNNSRFYPRRLTAEVMLDAVDTLLGAPSEFAGMPPGIRAVQLPDNGFNSTSYFLTVFGRPDASTSCECERSQEASLAQSLHLLNAKDIQQKLGRDGGRAALLAADASTAEDQKIQSLYLLAFARQPSGEELQAALKYLEKSTGGSDAAARRRAFEDLIWAIVNTKEFAFNH